MVNRHKSLSDAGWKDIAAEFQVKDRGLHKALERFKRIEDHEHEELSKALAEITKVATQLKSDKTVAGTTEVTRYIAEVLGGAQSTLREVAKAREQHEKQQKAEAAEAKEAKETEAEEDSPELLTTKMAGLVRQVAKGDRMHALIAQQGKNVAVLLARKAIPPSRRPLLCELLGGSGGVKYFPAACLLEDGATTFVLKADVSGMANRLKAALFAQTGIRINGLRCRGIGGVDAAGDDDPASPASPAVDPAGAAGGADGPVGMARPFELSAAVGKGCKNLEDDVSMVQAALNRRMNAGLDVNGRYGNDTAQAIVDFQRALGLSRPDGRVEPKRAVARALAARGKMPPPPPPPKPIAPPADWGPATVARAPKVWHGTRRILGHNISELKRAISQQYANEHPDLLAEIDRNVARVDVILQRLDQRLSDTLDRANAAAEAAERRTHVDAAKVILADYIRFVRSEPLIDHVDNNPFDVATNVRKVITDSLKHLAKSIS